METKHRIMEIIDFNRTTMTDADYLSCSNWLMRAGDPEALQMGIEYHELFRTIEQQRRELLAAIPSQRERQLEKYSTISCVLFFSVHSSALTIMAREHSKELSICLLIFLGSAFMVVEFLRCLSLYC